MKNFADRVSVGLLEAAPDAMVCVDGQGQILLVNGQAERLFGYGRDELGGQPVEVLVPEVMRDVHRGYRSKYAADPQPRPMGHAALELSGRRRDGSTFPAEISLSAIDTDAGIVITAAVRDITARLESQAEQEQLKFNAERDRLALRVQQSQRLESLGQLAGGVAHDFNNLLGIITNYASFVADELSSPAGHAGESALSDVEQIQLAAERAAQLTRQLLAFARREVIQPRVVDLNQVVTGVMQLLQRTLGEHVELITDLDPELSRVCADPGQVEQILVNLAVNARDAMPGGGKLTIETSNVGVDKEYAATHTRLPPGQYTALKVSDNGTGMPREVADRAFEPFFTTKPKGEGSGLGLATIYGIVTQAEGNVRIYSEPGLGTTVTVLLPVTDELPAATGRAADHPELGQNELVLVVEDEPGLREVTRRILAGHGYQVITAADGPAAIKAAATHEGLIDMLLTDMIMPGMQGREVASRVRELQPGIAVLYMSGYTHGLLSSQGALEPGISLIEKPFSEAPLLHKIREVLDPRQPAAAPSQPGT